MLSAGVPPSKVQKLVGHKDYEMMELYTRLHAEELVGATEGISIGLGDVFHQANIIPI